MIYLILRSYAEQND